MAARRSALSACAGTCAVVIVLLFAPQLADARSTTSPPALAPPSGTIVNVATEAQLQAAIRNVASNVTIVLAPGTYRLTSTLWINGSFTNVAIRGGTNNRSDVTLQGPGMTNTTATAVPFGIWTGGSVHGITIANLTIRDFNQHPIVFNAGTESPRVYNVRLLDAGQQFIKANPDNAGGGVDNGIVEYSVIEYTTRAKDGYTNGVDVHAGANWIIRHNLFRNIVAPAGQLAGPAVLMWNGSSNTVVEGNTFLNCARGVALGLDDKPGAADHRGGVVRNNFFYRSSAQPGDVPILVADSPATQVLNNTVLVSGTYPSAVEYRFAGTTGVLVANNLVDAAVSPRDGATGSQKHNVTTATAGLFVNAAAGDLHLRQTASIAIDRGTAVSGNTTDWDGDPRPRGTSYDIGADEYASASNPPTPIVPSAKASVAITSPSANTNYDAPATISITATASNPAGTIARVRFYAGSLHIGSDTTAPYAFKWTNVKAGAYALTAVLVDASGKLTKSAIVNVTVKAKTTNTTPNTTGRLLQSGDLKYQGAFRLPNGTFGSTYGFAYAGTGLAFNPVSDSLFINGHTYEQKTAEVTIPAVINSRSLTDLNTATVIQNFADITEGHLADIGTGGAQTRHPIMGGLLVYGSRLVGTSYEYYDVSGFARLSHFTSGESLAARGDYRGMFQVGSMDPGYYAGYMAAIPAEWQAALGGPALTGLCCVPGPYRTSMGPGAFAFDPDDLGARTPVPATPLVYYSSAHPTLGTWEGNGTANPVYNMGTTIGGVVFPQGTSSVLFFGRTGLGAPCYGPGTSDPALAGKPSGDGVDPWCYDPDNSAKGTHAYPYAAFVWAYDANDLALVKKGAKHPWDVKPYATWKLTSLASAEVIGAAYDPVTRRIFVSEAYADGVQPLVHVFAVP